MGRNKNVPREIGRNINLNFAGGGGIDRSAGNRGRRPRGKEFFQFCKSVINKGGRATHSVQELSVPGFRWGRGVHVSVTFSRASIVISRWIWPLFIALRVTRYPRNVKRTMIIAIPGPPSHIAKHACDFIDRQHLSNRGDFYVEVSDFHSF